MNEFNDNDVNPQTGRNRKGQFAKGNQIAPKKRKQSQVTMDLRTYANERDLTLMAVKRLEDIAKNKGGNFSENAQIRACEILMKQFNVTVEKEIDKEIVENNNATISEMFSALKENIK